MLDVRSPLVDGSGFTVQGICLREDAGFTLTQVAGTEKGIKKLLGKVPAKVGSVAQNNDLQILRVGPKQYWVLGDAPSSKSGVYTTPLSSGRSRFALSGEMARAVLSSCMAIDFHSAQFKPGQFVMSGIHHTPVLVHCIEKDAFYIYVLRTFAQAVWEWLVDVAEGLKTDA